MPDNLDYVLTLVDDRFRGSSTSRMTSFAQHVARLHYTSYRFPLDNRVKHRPLHTVTVVLFASISMSTASGNRHSQRKKDAYIRVLGYMYQGRKRASVTTGKFDKRARRTAPKSVLAPL